MPDAKDYIDSPEVQRMLANESERVRESIRENPEAYLDENGKLDPRKVEAEVQGQQLALRETLMYDLPDEYLSPEELKEREQRRKEIPTFYEPEEDEQMETVEGEEGKLEEAKNIALRGGAIRRCPIHSDVLIDQGDPTQAYKIGAAMFRDKELQGDFRSVREVTDTIKMIVDEAGLECPSCEKD